MLPQLKERVKPQRGDDDDDELLSGSSSDEFDEDRAESIEEHETSQPEDDLGDDIGNLSFGALAKAQRTLGKRKRIGLTEAQAGSEKLSELRQKLQEAREKKEQARDGHSRSSKHAPTELSSRKAVTRRREVVPVAKRAIRDPRFESLGGPVNPEKTRSNYAFLEQYQLDEMKQLKDAIRKTKDEGAKAKLKRELLSMESKRKAQEAKDQQQEILRRHRAQEKELIKQGKKPFYLKKAEQKKLALVERYSGLKEKQLERVMERRRKKKASKERRNMPLERRGVSGPGPGPGSVDAPS
ncbi:MAG: rRNA biogenesis protein rrp36 [Thelocarpon superellum]|nr:MAG: rRNA biogenesis protein rrp36 [Thelocarpon superellum]